MQATTKFSEKQPTKQAVKDYKKVSESPVKNKEMVKDKEHQQPASGESTTIVVETADTLAEAIESTASKAHQEVLTEQSEGEIAANEAATPTPSPVVELAVADDDLFEGASFPTAQKSPVRKVGSALAVINHKNGKRIKFSTDIEKQLQLEEGDTVNIAVKSDEIIFIKVPSGNGFGIGAKRTIYGTKLVELITRQFQLDFTVASTQHLMNVDFKNYQGKVVAIITK